MPRERREHEDHLESIEPVGVVVLNDVCYLLQDISEIILDMGKLLRDRRDEIMGFLDKVKEEGPGALAESLPDNFMPFLMGAVGELAGLGMELKGQVETDKDEEEEPRPGLRVDVDPDKVQPEMLEKVGSALREKTEALEAMIGEFEAKLLADNPPPA